MYTYTEDISRLEKVPNNKYADHNLVWSYKGRHINLEKPIQVYRNLNIGRGWYSIRQNGLVVAHAGALVIANAVFKVSPKGRERIRKTQIREIHAWIEGIYETSGMGTTAKVNDLPVVIRYNPFIHEGFIDVSHPNKILKNAWTVIINKSGGVRGAYVNFI